MIRNNSLNTYYLFNLQLVVFGTAELLLTTYCLYLFGGFPAEIM